MTPFGSTTIPGKQRSGLMRKLNALLEEVASGASSATTDLLREAPDLLLEDTLRERATDLHLDPQKHDTRVRFRIDGQLLEAGRITHELGSRIIRHFQALSGMDLGGQFHPADARLSVERDGRQVDLRLSCAPSLCGEKLTMRLLDRATVEQKIDELGLTETHRIRIQRWLTDGAGLFCIAGPTASGKTTTAYALLHALKNASMSVVTVEDPVEYQVDGIVQLQVDRRHELNFATALRGVLRLDPDCILIGEVRDPAGAAAAVEMAGSGRAVLTTVHAPDAVGALAALRHLGVAAHELSTVVQTVVAQRLVRKLCVECRVRRPVGSADVDWLGHMGLHPGTEELWTPVGCSACRGLGYCGRVGVFEVWRPDDEDRRGILHHDDQWTLRGQIRLRGLRSLLDDAYEKAMQGLTSIDELRRIAAGYAANGDEAR